MTPKEKAEWLIIKMFQPLPASKEAEKGKEHLYYNQYNAAKQCALIAVDEIIESSPLDPNDAEEWLQPEDWFSDANIFAEKYWKEVKKEIEKL